MKIDFLEEPELEFGAGCHVDVRFGLMNYGPFDFESSVSPRKVNVGVIGTPETIEGVCQWLEKCRAGISARKSNQPNLFPHFPGFRDDNALQTTLVLDQQLQFGILPREFDKLHCIANSALAIEKAVDLFLQQLEALAEKKTADVAVCALPMSLIKHRRTKGDAADTEQDEILQSGLDFHHLLKAKAMPIGVPIQLVLPMTYDSSKRLPQRSSSVRLRTLQDEATKAWNFHVALYYKAGGLPWRLKRETGAYTTCYVGVSFYESVDKSKLLTSVAQVFNERGDGIVVRGSAARIDKVDRQPHVDEQGARTLLKNALDAYEREHHTMPARVVLHKTSLFSAAEESGFRAAVDERRIYSLDLVTLHDSTTRLFRVGLYPPLRGTLLTVADDTQVLYTKGSVDFFSTYPGMYAPQTLGIHLHSAEQAPRFLSQEVLALTKMNWNNTQFDGSEPITIRAARQVGQILKYVPEGGCMQHRYSFYM